jgi:hypothetical protein
VLLLSATINSICHLKHRGPAFDPARHKLAQGWIVGGID